MITRINNIALFLILVSALIFAQEQKKIQLTPEQQKMMSKYIKLNKQITAIQQQAMNDPEIIAKKEALDQKVIDLMIINDPSIEKVIQKREQLAAELKSLQGSDNQEKISSLEEQYKEVSKTLRDAQNGMFTVPEIVAEIEQFEADVKKKMAEIDPNYSNLAASLEEIKSQLSSTKLQTNKIE